MIDVVHIGDLAEYRGTVKTLSGQRCEVIDRLQYICVHVRLADGRLIMRWVKPDNLKRLGGGCLKANGIRTRDEA